MRIYKLPNFSQTEEKIYPQTDVEDGNEMEASLFYQEKRFLEKLGDILAEENLITPLEQIRLKEKIENYRGTL